MGKNQDDYKREPLLARVWWNILAPGVAARLAREADQKAEEAKRRRDRRR